MPRIISADATIRHAELVGSVIIGEESAKKLTKKYGKEFKAGDTIDVGTLAIYDENPIKNWLSSIRLRFKKNIFN